MQRKERRRHESYIDNETAQAEEPGQQVGVVDGNGSRQFSRQASNFVDAFTSLLSGSSDWD